VCELHKKNLLNTLSSTLNKQGKSSSYTAHHVPLVAQILLYKHVWHEVLILL